MLMRLSALPPVGQERAGAGVPQPLAASRIAGSGHGDEPTAGGAPQ
jgi:hypothetical protein